MKNIVIYGAGKLGKAYVDRLLACGMQRETLRLVDTNSVLWGEKYQNIEIQNPQIVFRESYELVVVSVSDRYREQILQQLKEVYIVPEEKITFPMRTMMLPKSEMYDIDSLTLINMRENVFGREVFWGVWYQLYKTALQGMNIGTGGNLEHSGEQNVLNLLKAMGRKEKVLFDVGANIGNYTKELISNFPDGYIHSFEPSKETFKILSQNVSGKNVTLNNVGFSDEIGKGVLYSDKENSGLASLYDRKLDYLGIEFNRTEYIELSTLDYYCEIHHIDEIDFLKIDIEGNEYKALRGGMKLLTEKRIKAIQIETGGSNIDSRTYFRDFWDLLHNDYSVYRILQDGIIEVLVYEEYLECFITSNWLFVQR